MLLATRVGQPTTNTHNRKDGSGSFTSESTPIEFHGFELDPVTGFITVDWGIKHTLWTNDAEVIAEATVSNWTDNQSGQVLCLDAARTKLGDNGLKPVEFKTRSGEIKSALQRSIWIVGDATWDFIARPVSSDRGNLAAARAKAGLPARAPRIETTSTVDTSVSPFG
jgi:hypothetical protein